MTSQEVTFHDVWADNLDEEFAKLRGLTDNYPFVAMDTEFPGLVATPMGQFKSKEDFNYQMLCCNVNMLKVIQVGFALVNAEGILPPGGDIWQFNFHFSLSEDMYSTESVDLLKASGLDFDRHKAQGIHMEEFGELLTTSGLIVEPNITWITFHSYFDFGYLIKCILNGRLPVDEKTFFRYHKGYFPTSYDVKMLTKQPGPAAILKGGLQEVADTLKVERIGQRHQAGSDALLTARTFFKLKEQFFASNWDEISKKIQGEMYGLGTTLSTYLHPPAAQLANNSTVCTLSANEYLNDATATSGVYSALHNDELESLVSLES